jgi:Flp pilus assembly protein TadD
MGDAAQLESGPLHRKVAELRRLSNRAPNDPELRMAVARLLLDLQLKDEAVVELRAVIAMAPNSLEARQLLDLAVQGRESRLD